MALDITNQDQPTPTSLNLNIIETFIFISHGLRGVEIYRESKASEKLESPCMSLKTA